MSNVSNHPDEASLAYVGNVAYVRYMMSSGNASALANLQFHWDECYEIGCDQGTWWARRRDAASPRLEAGSASDLRELIRVDHHRRTSANYGPLSERMST